MKDGEKKEDMFRIVQMSSAVAEPQDKRCYTEVGEGLRKELGGHKVMGR